MLIPASEPKKLQQFAAAQVDKLDVRRPLPHDVAAARWKTSQSPLMSDRPADAMKYGRYGGEADQRHASDRHPKVGEPRLEQARRRLRRRRRRVGAAVVAAASSSRRGDAAGGVAVPFARRGPPSAWTMMLSPWMRSRIVWMPSPPSSVTRATPLILRRSRQALGRPQLDCSSITKRARASARQREVQRRVCPCAAPAVVATPPPRPIAPGGAAAAGRSTGTGSACRRRRRASARTRASADRAEEDRARRLSSPGSSPTARGGPCCSTTCRTTWCGCSTAARRQEEPPRRRPIVGSSFHRPTRCPARARRRRAAERRRLANAAGPTPRRRSRASPSRRRRRSGRGERQRLVPAARRGDALEPLTDRLERHAQSFLKRRVRLEQSNGCANSANYHDVDGYYYVETTTMYYDGVCEARLVVGRRYEAEDDRLADARSVDRRQRATHARPRPVLRSPLPDPAQSAPGSPARIPRRIRSGSRSSRRSRRTRSSTGRGIHSASANSPRWSATHCPRCRSLRRSSSLVSRHGGAVSAAGAWKSRRDASSRQHEVAPVATADVAARRSPATARRRRRPPTRPARRRPRARRRSPCTTRSSRSSSTDRADAFAEDMYDDEERALAAEAERLAEGSRCSSRTSPCRASSASAARAAAASRSSRTSGRTAALKNLGATRRRRMGVARVRARARPRGRAGGGVGAVAAESAGPDVGGGGVGHRRPRGPHAPPRELDRLQGRLAPPVELEGAAVPRARDARRQDAPPRQLCDRRGGTTPLDARARPRRRRGAIAAEATLASGGATPPGHREN